MKFRKSIGLLSLVLGISTLLPLEASANEDTWSCSDGTTDCSSLFGYLKKNEPVESWPPLTVGNGKGTGGLELKFTPNDIVLGDLIVTGKSIVSVRKFNLSNFSSTRNGVPRQFRIAYQVVFATKDGIRGFIFDVLDYKIMTEVDLRLASWNPALVTFTNNAWTP